RRTARCGYGGTVSRSGKGAPAPGAPGLRSCDVPRRRVLQPTLLAWETAAPLPCRPCAADGPGARFVESRKGKVATPAAQKVKKKSSKWYGCVPDNPRPVPLSANKVAAQPMLAELVKEGGTGEGRHPRPLRETPQAAVAGTPGGLRALPARQGRH